MATIGVDCQIVLDGTGYFLEPNSYTLSWPRIRRATYMLDGEERYTDLGPGKCEWKMVALCLNELTDYGGRPLGVSGSAMRNALRVSYGRVSTILSYLDLDGGSYQVHFDHLDEQVRDPRTQIRGGVSYHLGLVLVEA